MLWNPGINPRHSGKCEAGNQWIPAAEWMPDSGFAVSGMTEEWWSDNCGPGHMNDKSPTRGLLL
jgi:hypothetical protein